MAKTLPIAAIDIGTQKITTLIASPSIQDNQQINVIGVATSESKGIRKSQVVDIEAAIAAITESVEAAERMAGLNLSAAYVSISGIHVDSQNSTGVVAVAEPEGEITQNDIQRVIEAAKAISLPSAKEVIHILPRQFKVDSQDGIKDPAGMSGIRLESEVHLITASSTALKNVYKCIEELGINVISPIFASLASSYSTLTNTEKELGVVLVDIGAGSSSMTVWIDGAVAHSAVLPVGARNITNDLAIGMRLSLESAEQVKLYLSKVKKPNDEDKLDLKKINIKEDVSTTSYKTLTEGIIRPRLNEIFSMIGQELKDSGFGGTTPAGVVLCGGGASTINIVDACKRTLSLPTRIGTPVGLSGLVEEVEEPAFATIVGMILYAKNETQESIPSIAYPSRKIPVAGLVKKASDFFKQFLP